MVAVPTAGLHTVVAPPGIGLEWVILNSTFNETIPGDTPVRAFVLNLAMMVLSLIQVLSAATPFKVTFAIPQSSIMNPYPSCPSGTDRTAIKLFDLRLMTPGKVTVTGGTHS
jgi:hypothetical protein